MAGFLESHPADPFSSYALGFTAAFPPIPTSFHWPALSTTPYFPPSPMRYDDNMDSNIAVGAVGANASSSDFVSLPRLCTVGAFFG